MAILIDSIIILFIEKQIHEKYRNANIIANNRFD